MKKNFTPKLLGLALTAALALTTLTACGNSAAAPARPDSTGTADPIQGAAGTAVGESYWGAFHEIQVRDCYEALLEGRAMPWTPQDAKKTLEIVQAIYLSARVGSDVTL